LDERREVEHHDPVGRDRFSAGRFGRDESGASSIEHGLLACIFALVIVYAVAIGFTPGAVYDRISSSITGVFFDAQEPVPTPVPAAERIGGPPHGR
jgi:Flp pilus assembly pilin Flp